MSSRATIVVLAAALVAQAGCAGTDVPTPRPLVIEPQTRAWNTPRTPGTEFLTAHYRIFTTVTRRPLRQYLPGAMEAAYRQYLELTGLADRPANRRMDVYVMATRHQWAALTTARLGENAPHLNISAGGYCHEGVCALWDIGTRATLSVAAHEGLHQFFAHRMEGALPMWLEEGLCSMMEGHTVRRDTIVFTPVHNPSRHGSLRTAIINGHWIPIKRLLPMDAGDTVGGTPGKAVGYYGQVWALSLFLWSVPEYRAGVQRLIRDARDGRLHLALGWPEVAILRLRRMGRPYNRTVSEPLFKHYISDDVEAFDRDYLAFARKLAGLK